MYRFHAGTIGPIPEVMVSNGIGPRMFGDAIVIVQNTNASVYVDDDPILLSALRFLCSLGKFGWCDNPCVCSGVMVVG